MTSCHFSLMTYNLDNPHEARIFCKKVRVLDGCEISFIVRSDGSHVTLDEATDHEILKLASELSLCIGGMPHEAS